MTKATRIDVLLGVAIAALLLWVILGPVLSLGSGVECTRWAPRIGGESPGPDVHFQLKGNCIRVLMRAMVRTCEGREDELEIAACYEGTLATVKCIQIPCEGGEL